MLTSFSQELLAEYSWDVHKCSNAFVKNLALEIVNMQAFELIGVALFGIHAKQYDPIHLQQMLERNKR